MTLTHGSLFAGIGGFDLGFERAGFETVWQVEIDEYCRRVLERHFPRARRYHNIKRVKRLAWVDVITGGFPCQDISSAGRRRGIDGKQSGLWSEMWRIIRIVRPRFVVVENSAALLHRGIERVIGNLAESGYDAEWDCLPACAFGAYHQRDRVFIVAYPRGEQYQSSPFANSRKTTAIISANSKSNLRRTSWDERSIALDRSGALLADTRRDGLERSLQNGNGSAESAGVIQRSEAAGTISQAAIWAVEPNVGRVADGVTFRVDRLRGLGNAVVPQIAQCIAERIKAVMANND